ncbi:MAG TPA: DUF2231 domain-containing protein [Nitrospiraceae bacterium]|nr:DUF2231 domain-containing protein [Nitrospiraceae bacterium]
MRQAWRLMELSAPLHPILVHFTIALMIASLGADTIGYLFSVASLADTGWWTMVGSLAVTPLTLITGAISRRRIPIEEGPARSFVRSHMALGPVVFGLLVALMVWRAEFWQHGHFVSGWYLLGVYGAGLVMTVQGYLGGEIVYRYGAEVKRAYREMPGHSTQGLPPLLPSSSRVSASVREAMNASREESE